MLDFSGIVLFACLLKIHPFELLEVPENGRMTVLFKKVCAKGLFFRNNMLYCLQKKENKHPVSPGMMCFRGQKRQKNRG